MLDAPYSPENDPQYIANIMEPLALGEGVACFVAADSDGSQRVLYCSHRLSGEAEEIATDEREFVRAAQAVAIQREARTRAAEAGFTALIA